MKASEKKYDATAGSMIGLLKYGSGLPFNRLNGLQGNLEVPLPASTQWDIVRVVAANVAPAFEELVRAGGAGDVLHNDDTTVKILELMGPDGRQNAAPCSTRQTKERRRRAGGLYTSGRGGIARRPPCRLFLQRPLPARGRELWPRCLRSTRGRDVAAAHPDVRCLSLQPAQGAPDDRRAYCLAHARRQFVDIYDRFPEPCRHLLETLAVVYRNDAIACERQLTPRRACNFIRKRERADDARTERLADAAAEREASDLVFSTQGAIGVYARALEIAGLLPQARQVRWTTTWCDDVEETIYRKARYSGTRTRPCRRRIRSTA